MNTFLKTASVLLFLSVIPCVQSVFAQDSLDDFTEYLDSAHQTKSSFEKRLIMEDTYQEAKYEYYIQSLHSRKDAFAWSHTSSKIIFWMVLVIVFFGLVFSSIQFYISMLRAKQRTLTKEGQEVPTEPATGTSLKISMSGLEVNSSVLGIIILVLSLGFFYIYLIHVYPVKEYNTDGIAIPKSDSTRSSEEG